MAIGPNDRTQRMTPTQAYDASIDAGLRSYMLGVYNYMAAGVAITGLMAYVVSTQPALMQTLFRLRLVLCRHARTAWLRAGVDLWHQQDERADRTDRFLGLCRRHGRVALNDLFDLHRV